jgi:hypothetical protein
MTATIEVAEVSEQRAVALPTLRVDRSSRALRRTVSSTTLQSWLVLLVEFAAFAAVLAAAHRAIGEPVFMVAFFGAYALATAMTYRWRARLNLSVLDDLPRLVVSVAAAAGIAYWVAAGIGHWTASGAWNAPRPRPIAVAVAAALAAIVLAKVVSYVLVRLVRASGSHQGTSTPSWTTSTASARAATRSSGRWPSTRRCARCSSPRAAPPTSS